MLYGNRNVKGSGRRKNNQRNYKSNDKSIIGKRWLDCGLFFRFCDVHHTSSLYFVLEVEHLMKLFNATSQDCKCSSWLGSLNLWCRKSCTPFEECYFWICRPLALSHHSGFGCKLSRKILSFNDMKPSLPGHRCSPFLDGLRGQSALWNKQKHEHFRLLLRSCFCNDFTRVFLTCLHLLQVRVNLPWFMKLPKEMVSSLAVPNMPEHDVQVYNA